MSTENVTKMCQNKTYIVKEIEPKLARSIVKQYHYSGKVVSNSKLHLGVFNHENILVGCLQFGPPINGKKTSNKISECSPMVELNRMVMRDEEPRNSESTAISLCIKYLKKYTEYKWVLSFSDGKQGNVGYIYQATNWKYIGYILSKSFYKLDGNFVHSITVWHRYKEKKSDPRTTDIILCDTFSDVRKVSCKQHIYVYPLVKNVNFLFENKKYPKLETEFPIISETILKENGSILSHKKVTTYTTEKICPIF